MIVVRIALAGLAVITAFCSRYIVSSLRSAWMLRGVPSPPEGSLLGGHVKVMADFKGHRQIQKWTHQFGGFMKLRMYWQHVRALPSFCLKVISCKSDKCQTQGKFLTSAGDHYKDVVHLIDSQNVK